MLRRRSFKLCSIQLKAISQDSVDMAECFECIAPEKDNDLPERRSKGKTVSWYASGELWLHGIKVWSEKSYLQEEHILCVVEDAQQCSPLLLKGESTLLALQVTWLSLAWFSPFSCLLYLSQLGSRAAKLKMICQDCTAQQTWRPDLLNHHGLRNDVTSQSQLTCSNARSPVLTITWRRPLGRRRSQVVNLGAEYMKDVWLFLYKLLNTFPLWQSNNAVHKTHHVTLLPVLSATITKHCLTALLL